MPLINADRKQALMDVYKKAVASAKETAVSIIKEKTKEVVSIIMSTTGVQAALKAVNTVKGAIDTAGKTYTTAKNAASKEMAMGYYDQSMNIEVAKQSADAIKNSKLKSSGLDVDIGLTKKTEILTSLDPNIEPDNSETGLILKLNGAKVKLNSIKELTDVVQTINRMLDAKDPVVTREWVHMASKLHPKVDDSIKSMEYFKPISNEVGSTHLMHTPDTQTLALGDWSTELPRLFRRSIECKLDNQYDTMNEVYYNLNVGMARNISTEFIDQRKSAGNNTLGKSIYNNDFHIAGDYSFARDHARVLYPALMTSLIGIVGGAGKLIKWLTPVNNSDVALCGGVTIKIDGKDITVDLRGNRIGVIAEIIDTTPIKPGDYK